MFYSKNKHQTFNKTMTRDLVGRQAMKLCFACSQPFSRRKGRGKAAQVAHVLGRFICEQCAIKQTNSEAGGKVLPGLFQ